MTDPQKVEKGGQSHGDCGTVVTVETPALDHVLRENPSEVCYGPDGWGCTDGWTNCPFVVRPSKEEQHGGDVSNDYSEAHYDCTLLGREVWGEYPPCEWSDWKKRARQELDASRGG